MNLPTIAMRRLCLRQRHLRMSHIVPEFLYRPLYGPTHQIRSIHPGVTRIRFLRKGLREALLCDDCESLVGRYETYFSGLWYGDHGFLSEIPAGVSKIMKSGLDYTQFKLFHLSILWRASISALEEFRGVALGPHQERFREMIIGKNPGRAAEYQLAASVLLRPQSLEVHGGVIGVPAPARKAGGWMYSSIYGGCMWHCFVSRGMSAGIDVLQEDGTLCMMAIDVRNVPFVSESLTRAATARRRLRRN
jgi:hypothetical protein